MVKIIRMIVCCSLCLMCLVGTQDKAAASTYNWEHIDYLSGYVSKLTPWTDYLLYSISSEETVLVVGSLEQLENVFYWEDSRMYRIVDDVLSVNESVSGSVNVSEVYCYSNVGDFPLLENGGDLYAKITCYLVCVVALSFFVLFTFRIRSH